MAQVLTSAQFNFAVVDIARPTKSNASVAAERHGRGSLNLKEAMPIQVHATPWQTGGGPTRSHSSPAGMPTVAGVISTMASATGDGDLLVVKDVTTASLCRARRGAKIQLLYVEDDNWNEGPTS
jgi:hypothetical protein